MTEPDIVRWKVEPLRAKGRRTWDGRLLVLAPRSLNAWIGRRVLRRSHRSGLSRRFLTRLCQIGWDATNRRDWDLVFKPFHPDYEFHFDPNEETHPVGFEAEYRGRERIRLMIEAWTEPLGGARYEPREILDAGDGRLAFLMELVGTGRGSGIELRERAGTTYRLTDGLVSWQMAWRGPDSWEMAEGALTEEAG
jgi:hypothetical protein